jgi:hypothetical protein
MEKLRGPFYANKLEIGWRKIKLGTVSLSLPPPHCVFVFLAQRSSLSLPGISWLLARAHGQVPSLDSWRVPLSLILGSGKLWSHRLGLTDLQDDYKVRAWFPGTIVFTFQNLRA